MRLTFSYRRGVRALTARIVARLVVAVAIPLLGLFASGCVPDPEAPVAPPPGSTGPHGVLVVNEGLWRQDNSTLTHYDPATGAVIDDYFAARNPGLRLGDTGNDIVVRNGRAYIAVTTSQTVEVIDVATGTSLGRVVLPANSDPRRICIAGDSVGYVSGFKDDRVTEFNPTTLAVRRRFVLGPAPEGLAIWNGTLFVGNSGYGNFRQSEPKASTISVIDSATGGETALIPAIPNPLQLVMMRSRLYVLSRPIRPDSVGALLEIDPVSRAVLRRWKMIYPVLMALDDSAGAAFVLAARGVYRVDVASAGEPALVVRAEDYPGAVFYSVGTAAGSDRLYVGNARDYTTPGEVLIFDRSGGLKGRFSVGLNPGSFGFY